MRIFSHRPFCLKDAGKFCLVSLLACSVVACATKGDDLPPAPSVILIPNENMPPASPQVTSVPGTSPIYKVGKAYKVAGIWYYPKEDPTYDEQGVASWYGPKFHGRLTANGEVFDMDRLSAAHPTLPLPSIVEVTNLSNGKTAILRVNDRGPFAHGRVIDLSRAAAEKLGYKEDGLANVRVRYLSQASLADAITTIGSPEPGEPVTTKHYAANTVIEPGLDTVQVRVATGPEIKVDTGMSDDVITSAEMAEARESVREVEASVIEQPQTTAQASSQTSVKAPVQVTQAEFEPDIDRAEVNALYLVQIGAFSQIDNANRAAEAFTADQPIRTQKLTNASGKSLYHVRLGPYPTAKAAKAALDLAIRTGFGDARIVQP